MKIECIHGYFRFSEWRAGEVSDFVSRYGIPIVRERDHFTFEGLAGAPDYSLPGGDFLGCPTTEAFEGEPWEVMRANELVFDFNSGEVVPIATILQTAKIQASGKFYVSSGMILPGSLTDEGKRVTDYAAFFENLSFRYSEVASE